MALLTSILIFSLMLNFGQSARHATLDRAGKYNVAWEIVDSRIQWDLVVETLGYVGFGLSHNGGMLGADIFLGGVFPNGSIYGTDRHGTGTILPSVDKIQDWDLLGGTENATHTTLSLSRLLNTCDEQDVEITSDTIKFIWSYGASDDISYHGEDRGAMAVNPLDVEYPPTDNPSYQREWTLNASFPMPGRNTVYFATTHKSPPLHSAKNHVTGFYPSIKTELAYKHIHHLGIYRCTPPEGDDASEFFEKYLISEGGSIHDPADRSKVPVEYCTLPIYSWAHGGRDLMFPPDVGFPIGEGQEYEYFMVVWHLNNPLEEGGVRINAGIKFEYTTVLRNIRRTPYLELPPKYSEISKKHWNLTNTLDKYYLHHKDYVFHREHDAGMMQVGHMLNTVGLLIPPQVEDFVIAGHCTPTCLGDVPSSGLNMFNIMFHAHNSARKIKLRHFRGNTELPWIGNDEHYDYDYQENRNIEYRKLYKEDQMTLECHYDTNWKSPSGVVLSGLGTEDEMCMTFIYYYPKLDRTLEDCSSTYPQEKLLARFGILNTEKVPGSIDPVILQPSQFANLTFTEMLDKHVDWTSELKQELQEEIRHGEHDIFCYHIDSNNNKQLGTRKGGYPNIDKTYVPPLDDTCQANNKGNNTVEIWNYLFALTLLVQIFYIS